MLRSIWKGTVEKLAVCGEIELNGPTTNRVSTEKVLLQKSRNSVITHAMSDLPNGIKLMDGVLATVGVTSVGLALRGTGEMYVHCWCKVYELPFEVN